MAALPGEEAAAEVIKHPLKHTWTFWLYTNTKKTWTENLVELTSFNTVEDYWCLYHHMKTPSELALGQDYAIFKQGIRPMWEDKANKRGGRWLINFDRKRAGDIDNVWLHTVLLMIGENFDNSDEICGVVVNVRAKSKVGVWVKNSKKEKAVLEIGHRLKQQFSHNVKLGFHVHDSTNNLYTL
ncbi:eukaryotic translation initiation factor 4E1-like [Battus philenor]|uniref:eukaryotic translation initiation factor 4E1-like n=1 Tax=Battus philenor TaxID=42288 RepID=UPI0035D00EB0